MGGRAAASIPKPERRFRRKAPKPAEMHGREVQPGGRMPRHSFRQSSRDALSDGAHRLERFDRSAVPILTLAGARQFVRVIKLKRRVLHVEMNR